MGYPVKTIADDLVRLRHVWPNAPDIYPLWQPDPYTLRIVRARIRSGKPHSEMIRMLKNLKLKPKKLEADPFLFHPVIVPIR